MIQELDGKFFFVRDTNGDLDYTYDLTKWCAKSGVNLTDAYTLTPIDGATIQVLAHSRSGDKITMTVRGGASDASTCCGEFTEGVRLHFTTTAGPNALPLSDDRTLYFSMTEN